MGFESHYKIINQSKYIAGHYFGNDF